MGETAIIQLPEKVRYIINRITEAGYEAYAVGGCVRDSLLGREPEDWDITTSATPYEIKGIFGHTIDTGIRHGTVTVMLEREGFEVTTYRIDGEYEDGRHPREVTFTPSLLEDLKRRDFTVNAMAYNERAGLVDAFDGAGDIRRRIIRCVGNPGERFSEDALRIMRAVRFSAQLGYEIEEETAKAMKARAGDLRKISAERIQAELVKLLVSPHPDYVRIAYETGITAVILPEFDACMATPQHNPHHCYDVGTHTLVSMKAVAPEKELRLSMLFHDMGKPFCLTTDGQGIHHFHDHPQVSERIAEDILHRLKFDNDTVSLVKKLVKYHDCDIAPTPESVRRALARLGEEVFPLLLQVKEADVMAQSDYLREEKLSLLKELWQTYQWVREQNQCVSLKTLAVNGRDLMLYAGMQAGRELGEMLERLLELVIEEPERNNREYLLSAAGEHLKKKGK